MGLPKEKLPGFSAKNSNISIDTSVSGELILWLFAFNERDEGIGLYSVYVKPENFQRAFDLSSIFARVKRKHWVIENE